MVVGEIENNTKRIFVQLLLLSALGFCVYHALSSYQSRQNGTESNGFATNLLRTPSIVAIENSKRKVRKLNASLSYLVWREDKAKATDLLRREIRSSLNLEPYDANNWNTLNAMEHNESLVLDDRLWALQNTLRLNSWSQKLQLQLSYYCILQEEHLSTLMRDDCVGVLKGLPFSKGVDWLAVNMGVDRPVLTDSMSRFGVGWITELKK
jgi:hypothetical protein